MSSKPGLTREQFQALRTYAEHEGSEWKKELAGVDWPRAGTDKWHSKDSYYLLQQVRNRFGPKWLMSFRFEDYEEQFND